MSRFFKAAVSSESDSESESSDEEPTIQQTRAAPSAKIFAYASDDDDDVRRVVRSEKEKRYEELKEVIKLLKNHKKIKDMANVLSDFESLIKAYDKAKKVVEKEGIPRFYIRTMVELEDFVQECWEDREGRKKMTKNNAKGLTTMRQKMKKYLRDFESDLAAYRESPDKEEGSASEAEEEEDSDDDDDEEQEKADKPSSAIASSFLKKKGKDESDSGSDSLDEDDDDYWKNSSDDDTTSSSSDDDQGDNLALKFLKKTEDSSKEPTKKEKSKAMKEKRTKIKREESDDEGGNWEEVKGGISIKQEKPKMFAKDAEITIELVCKKLSEIVSARGKKGTDRVEQIDLLNELMGICAARELGIAIKVKIMFNIIASVFDYNPNIATCMKREMWVKCISYIEEVLVILEEHDDITVSQNIIEGSEQLDTSPYRIRGCMLTIAERMDEEFTKMLQASDAHSTEYVEKLKDEQSVCTIIKRLQRYLEDKGITEEICRIYFVRIKHLYYKFDHTKVKMTEAQKNGEDFETPENYEDSCEVMDKLCKYIYAVDSTDRIRTRAILSHIYHHALHDRWYEARDLMLMSHLQDSIQHSDVPTQIYYNRAMVQLGLCAFRQGLIKDAHHCLVDIQSGGRAKELLAQGLLLQRQHERTAEQEKIEKRRQMPYHMHINLELLECVYLVSAMLLEIPYMAAHELDARRRMISKNFHHVLKLSERQPLVGPPESMREHVVAASKAMKTGDWRACKNFIINEKMNSKVWDLFYHAEVVRQMITAKIQEESLRTYLFTYSSVYDSISMKILSETFELDHSTVHSTISKMIINEELMASLDEPTQTVVMHRTEPTRLQALALQLSEKVASLVDNNERIIEMKQGTYFSYQKGKENFKGNEHSGGYRGNRSNQNNYHQRNQNREPWGNKNRKPRNY